MSKEIKIWLESSVEIEQLISDVDREFDESGSETSF